MRPRWQGPRCNRAVLPRASSGLPRKPPSPELRPATLRQEARTAATAGSSRCPSPEVSPQITGAGQRNCSELSWGPRDIYTLTPACDCVISYGKGTSQMWLRTLRWEDGPLLCTNLENSAVATGLKKVSFHSNSKERQCQRMLKAPHTCTHLTRAPSRARTLEAGK